MKSAAFGLVVCTLLAVLPGCTASGSLAHTHVNATAAANTAAKRSGIKTVLKMLEKIRKKTVKEIDKAEKIYNAIQKQCEEEMGNYKQQIIESTEKRESLDALVAKLLAIYGDLKNRLKELADQIAKEQSQLAEKKAEREESKKLFLKKEAELVETIGSLKSAISFLTNEQARSKREELSFVQLNGTDSIQAVTDALKQLLKSSMLDSASSKKLTALLQNSDSDEDQDDSQQNDTWEIPPGGIPDPPAKGDIDIYKHKSSTIVKLCENLLDEFTKELEDIRAKEREEKHQFTVLRISLGDAIEIEGQEKDDAETEQDETKAEESEAEGDQRTEEELLRDLEEMLDKIYRICMQKATEHDEQRKNRKKELEAIELAIKTLTEATGRDCSSGPVCPEDICPVDGKPRRLIGDDCCACPLASDKCAQSVCPKDMCSDGQGRRQIGNNCCGCPGEHEDKCKDASCIKDVCKDGAGRRPIGDNCCACPDDLPADVDAFLQTRPESFVQVSSHMRNENGETENADAVQFLKNYAKKQKSVMLTQFASKLQGMMKVANEAGDDPFVKVKGLISDLIAKLTEELASSATHKEFCDKGIANAKRRKKEVEDQIRTTTTSRDTDNSTAATHADEMEELAEKLLHNKEDQSTNQTARAQAREEYESERDADRRARQGVTLAIKILREYYDDADAKSSKNAGTTIIGILEMLESQIMENMALDKADQETSDKEFKDKIDELIKLQAEMTVRRTILKSKIDGLMKNIAKFNEALDDLNATLNSIVSGLDGLTEQCTTKVDSRAVQMAKRDAEIAGLKEALEILETQAAFVQVGTKHSRIRAMQRSLRGMRVNELHP